MRCNCNKAFPVPVGAGSLNLGVYKPNIAVYVIFETATGRRDVFKVTCDSTGNLQLPMPDLRLNTPYQVTLAEQADPEQTNKPWTVNSTPVDCISLQLLQAWEGDALLNPSVFAVNLKPW